jgi:Cyclic GMP-AMP synthase DncV-like, nucleotidyltransferase domain
MYNCHLQAKSFHDDRVTLTEEMKQGMRNRRSANQKRLACGLEKANRPKPLKHVKQGSYAMHTMVQAEFDASDIDDGVVFAKEDLVGKRGGEYTPLDSKIMVRDAIDDGSFKTPPEVRTNCVRVHYRDGFTLDIPVYREVKNGGETYYELASASWKRADPEGVTRWFNGQVIDKSPDSANGRQMRRIVKLLKAWSKSRKSWRMPSGFILSKLTDEKYYKDQGLLDRDDKALLQVMEAIHQRLQWDLEVKHPVVAENITKTREDANMVELRNRLADAVNILSVLRKSDCTELDALKALRDLFSTEYFDERIEELEHAKKSEAASIAAPFITVSGREPGAPVVKKGGEGRYA